MQDNKDLILKAKMLIADNLGVYISEKYEKFYEDKDAETIIRSLEVLLTDIIGSEPAKNQLKKYKIIL